MRALSVLLVMGCGTAFAGQTRSPAGAEVHGPDVASKKITITVTK